MVKISDLFFLRTVSVYSHCPVLIINHIPFQFQNCPGLNDKILYGHPCHGTMWQLLPKR